MAIRVVIGEDNYLVREGIREVLEVEEDIEVVSICTNYDGLRRSVDEEEPDVVLTDIRMPPSHTDEGIRLAAELHERSPETGVVVLSQYTDPHYAFRLLEHGTGRRAYLLKDQVGTGSQIAEAIRQVASGGSMVDAKVVESLVHATRRAEDSPLANLTQREREVLAEVAQGKSNSAIASSLFLTKRGVEKHINAIFAKLALPDDTDVSRRVVAALLFLSDEPELRQP